MLVGLVTGGFIPRPTKTSACMRRRDVVAHFHWKLLFSIWVHHRVAGWTSRCDREPTETHAGANNVQHTSPPLFSQGHASWPPHFVGNKWFVNGAVHGWTGRRLGSVYGPRRHSRGKVTSFRRLNYKKVGPLCAPHTVVTALGRMSHLSTIVMKILVMVTNLLLYPFNLVSNAQCSNFISCCYSLFYKFLS